MEFIGTERHGDLLVILLNRPKANALNAVLIEELHATITHGVNDASVRGFVLGSSRPRFFSTGFDAVEVFGYDRHTMRGFFERFSALTSAILRLPKPLVAAVNGHAFAGGAILALTADVRVMAEGEFGFALNEINLGLALSPNIVRMAVHVVGVQQARRLILEGATLTPAQCAAAGLANEVVPAEEVLERAIGRAKELAAKPPAAFAMMKRSIAETTGLITGDESADELAAFIEQWFSPEAMALKQALMQNLAKK